MPSSQGRQGGGEGGVPAAAALSGLSLEERVARLEAQLLPITPLYTIPQACALLPTRYLTLKRMLDRYREELDAPMYRHDSRHRRYRMLSHDDMLKLRARLIRRGARYRTRPAALAEVA